MFSPSWTLFWRSFVPRFPNDPVIASVRDFVSADSIADERER